MQIFSQIWASVVQYFVQLWEEIQLAASDYHVIVDTLDIALISYIIYKFFTIFQV